MFSTGPPEFFTVRPSARLHFTLACNGPEVVEYSCVGAYRTVAWPTPTGKSHSPTSVLARALLHSQIHCLPIFNFHGRVLWWRHRFLSDTIFFGKHVSNPVSDTFASTICNFVGSIHPSACSLCEPLRCILSFQTCLWRLPRLRGRLCPVENSATVHC